MTLKLIVLGLYMGTAFLLILLLGDSIFPGSLAQTAFSPLGIISILGLLMMESFFSYGRHE